MIRRRDIDTLERWRDENLVGLLKVWIQLLPSVDRGIRLLREGAPILDAYQLPAVAAGNPMLARDQPEPARLHDFDSFTHRFEARPDWFVRIEGDRLDMARSPEASVAGNPRHPPRRY